MKITKAIIPIAGNGTRFLPATKGVAKEMFPIVDIPVLMLIVEECLNSGINEICFILSKEKKDIKKFFRKDKVLEKLIQSTDKSHLLDRINKIIDNTKISFFYQGKRTGSAGALLPAKKWIKNQPFAVLYGDELNYTTKTSAIGQLAEVYEKTPGLIVGCQEVPQKEVCKYGAYKTDKKFDKNLFKVSGIVEKPNPGEEPSCIVGLGRYIMPENTFAYIKKQCKGTPINQELKLTDTMDLIMKDTPSYAVIMDSIRYDTGDKLGYLKAVVEYGLRDKKLGEYFKKYLKDLKL